MSFVFVLVAFGGWFLLAGLLAVCVAAIVGMGREGSEPFLVRVADDADRKRMVELQRKREYQQLLERFGWEREMERRMRNVHAGGWRS